ncbi:sigma-70 family RNA polymerase sigma factor [bacterium]|nr:sigma-70 family RNA polymerase sigma factor [bacterium]
MSRVHLSLKLKKIEESLTKELNRRPKLEEIAVGAEMELQDLRKFMVETAQVVSLDTTPVDVEDDLYLRDVVPDHDSDPLVISERKSLVDEIQKVFSTLSEREKIVLKHRFGLQFARSHTLEEIGKLLGLTRERVRQIEFQAIQKLRHPSRSRYLSVFRNS